MTQNAVESYSLIFDDGRSAELVASQLQTDCMFRCGSIRQTELITKNPMAESIPVYLYQLGYIEEPWDQLSHANDVNYLFGIDDDFTKIVQDFFGAYIRGEGVMIDGVDASIQNGKWIYVVDEVKGMDLKALPYTMVRERCEVMFDLQDDAFENYAFCEGHYFPEDDDDDDADDDDPEKSSSGFDKVKDAVCSLLCSD